MQIKSKILTLFPLTMLISGAIDNIRNLPTTALFGPSLISFFIFAAIVFLIPVALVSAHMAAQMPEKRGVYDWVKSAFGKKFALLAVWLQWINTMIWYPTILSFVAATLSYLINPALAHDKFYLVLVILGSFWLLTFINLRGIKASAYFASICTVFGMIIPMVVILILAIIWVVNGHPMQVHMTATNWLPELGHFNSWISLTAIMSAFLGMELASVHIKNVVKPQKTFPKALLISVTIILTTMIFGSLAIAFVIPAGKIQLVEGVMQAFTSFFSAYHMGWMIPVLAFMLVIGSLGSMINWIISPARGLLLAAEDGFLPKVLQETNQYGVAKNLLVMQAILVSLVCLAFLFMPSINGSYWLLTDMSTQLYVLMYIIMFIAALVLNKHLYKFDDAFKIIGGKIGFRIVCGLGLVGCLTTFVIGFFPPEGIDVGGVKHFEQMFIAGLVLALVPVFIRWLVPVKSALP